MKTIRSRINYYFFVCLSSLALGLSLAGYLGRINLYLEFVSGYKLQFLLLGLCSLIYFGFTRKKAWIVVSLLCALLNLAEIIPWYFNQPQVTNTDQYQLLKVISYNVLWDNKNYKKAIALINQEQPDIAVFQEAITPWAKQLSVLKAN
ncbi:MAG: endonuclease/exonuclease/phosphatase family protein, partial [Waterburya sp.]